MYTHTTLIYCRTSRRVLYSPRSTDAKKAKPCCGWRGSLVLHRVATQGASRVCVSGYGKIASVSCVVLLSTHLSPCMFLRTFYYFIRTLHDFLYPCIAMLTLCRPFLFALLLVCRCQPPPYPPPPARRTLSFCSLQMASRRN